MTELWDVTCHVGSHSVTCYPAQVNVPRLTPARSRVLHLPSLSPEGWKAELIWWLVYTSRCCTCLQTVTHPSIKRAWRRVTR